MHEISATQLAVGADHNLAKVGVEGSNPFARSNYNSDLATVHINALSVEYRSTAHAGRSSCSKGKKLTPSRAAISLLEGAS